jgi:Ca2+-binding EF-hand superfamily protein
MGRLDVRVVEAKDLSKPVDTQVKLRLENKSHKTSTVKHSMNPRYDEVFRLLVQDTDSSQLRVELIERGAISDSVIGTYDLSLSGLYMGEVADKWIKLKKTKHGREEVHLRVSATDFGLIRELKSAAGAANLKAEGAAGSVSASPTPPAHGLPAAPGVSHRHGAPGQCASLLQPSPSSSVYLPPSSPQHTISSSSNHSQQYSQQLAYSHQQHHQYPPHYYAAQFMALSSSHYPSQHHHRQPTSPYPPPYPSTAYYGPVLPPPASAGHARSNSGSGVFGSAYPSLASYPQPTAAVVAFAPPPGMELPRPGVLPPPCVPRDSPPWEKLGVSRPEFDHLSAIFARLDSHALTVHEVSRMARWLNYATSDQDTDRMYLDMGRARSETVTQAEFCRWLAYNRPDPHVLYDMNGMDYDAILTQFRRCDRDSTGGLTRSEFEPFAQAIGWADSAEDAAALYKRIDLAKFGSITLHEFLSFRSSPEGRQLKATMEATRTQQPPTPQPYSLPHKEHDHHHQPRRRSSQHGSTDEATADLKQHRRSSQEGATDPKQTMAIEQVRVLFPSLTVTQARAALERNSWNPQLAIEACLVGNG